MLKIGYLWIVARHIMYTRGLSYRNNFIGMNVDAMSLTSNRCLRDDKTSHQRRFDIIRRHVPVGVVSASI